MSTETLARAAALAVTVALSIGTASAPQADSSSSTPAPATSVVTIDDTLLWQRATAEASTRERLTAAIERAQEVRDEAQGHVDTAALGAAITWAQHVHGDSLPHAALVSDQGPHAIAALADARDAVTAALAAKAAAEAEAKRAAEEAAAEAARQAEAQAVAAQSAAPVHTQSAAPAQTQSAAPAQTQSAAPAQTQSAAAPAQGGQTVRQAAEAIAAQWGVRVEWRDAQGCGARQGTWWRDAQGGYSYSVRGCTMWMTDPHIELTTAGMSEAWVDFPAGARTALSDTVRHEASHLMIARTCGTTQPAVAGSRYENVTDAYAALYAGAATGHAGGYGYTAQDAAAARAIHAGRCS